MSEGILSYVVSGLARARGRWPDIAAESGVPYRTIQKIGSGKTPAPRIDTVEKLAKYFREQSAE